MKTLNYILIILTALCLCTVTFSETDTIRYIFLSIGLVSLITFAGLFNYQQKIQDNNSKNPTQAARSRDTSGLIHDELDQLFELLESAVKEDLEVVKQELLQIKALVNNAVNQLSESFYSVSTNTDEQQRLIKALLEALNTVNNDKTLLELDQAHKSIKNSSAIAVQSLQFEDIVVQVSDNSIQYIDNLDKFLNEFRSRLAEQLKHTTANNDTADQLQTFLDDVKTIRKNRLLPDRKAANQKNMSQGDVELF